MWMYIEAAVGCCIKCTTSGDARPLHKNYASYTERCRRTFTLIYVGIISQEIGVDILDILQVLFISWLG